jgi:negative regulator of flagellin synthesis FlgM
MNIHTGFDSIQPMPRDTPVVRTAGSTASQAGPVPSSSSASISDGDTTSISPAALSAAAAAGVADVRGDKVAAIQQALARGSYAVSPSDVAGKLIDHLLQS